MWSLLQPANIVAETYNKILKKKKKKKDKQSNSLTAHKQVHNVFEDWH